MNGRLRTGRTASVKRAAGCLSPFTGLSSWEFARCIPPALDRLKRRYSQGTISPWKKWGSPMPWSQPLYKQKPNRKLRNNFRSKP